MSINPETDLDLEKLFLPAWAQESSSANRYADFDGRAEERFARRGERHGRGPRDKAPPRGRPDRSRREKGGPQEGDRRRPDRRGAPRGDRPQRYERREAPPPLPEVTVALRSDEKSADLLARQIKTTGRAYPLFEIAVMILQKPDRHLAAFTSNKGPDGQAVVPMFVCALDDTLWLSADEAVSHVLRNHLSTFYQAERTEKEPPKGTYTFVAQCGMSGTILGPPNHHDYQNKLRELHTKRFSRVPFEVYKSRVRIVRDEAVVKQWIEEQSWRTEYVVLNVPDPVRLSSLEEVERHFRDVHMPNIIRQVDSHTLTGTACRSLRGGLHRLFRRAVEDQRRFPIQIATSLSQQFASRGLQFFKVNRTITHVWVARPNYLDLESSPVSDNVRRIVQFINGHAKCTRRQLLETLAPIANPPVSGTEAATPAEEQASDGQAMPKKAKTPPKEPEPTPEQTAIIADLHWLVHQGHVIEFGNGTLETAKKPMPKPPQPAAKPKPTAVTAAAGDEPQAEAAEGVDAAAGSSADQSGAEQPSKTEPTVTPSAPVPDAPSSGGEEETKEQVSDTPAPLQDESASVQSKPESTQPEGIPEAKDDEKEPASDASKSAVAEDMETVPSVNVPAPHMEETTKKPADPSETPKPAQR